MAMMVATDSSSAGRKDGGFHSQGQVERCESVNCGLENGKKPVLEFEILVSGRFGECRHGRAITQVVATQGNRESICYVCGLRQGCQSQLNFHG